MFWKSRSGNDHAGPINAAQLQPAGEELSGSLLHSGRSELPTRENGSPLEKKIPELSGPDMPPGVVELDHGTSRPKYELN